MKNKINMIKSLTFISFVIVLILLVGCSKQNAKSAEGVKAFEKNPQSEMQKTAMNEFPAKNLNPNTGNLYSDIKVRMTEVLQ